jgi:hypothetical protein
MNELDWNIADIKPCPHGYVFLEGCPDCKKTNDIDMKTMFYLSLPEGSKCIALSAIEKLCIAAAFDVPERGTEIYILNPNTGKAIKVEGVFDEQMDQCQR